MSVESDSDERCVTYKAASMVALWVLADGELVR